MNETVQLPTPLVIELELKDREELVTRLLPNPPGGLSVAGPAPGPLGQLVEVHLRLTSQPRFLTFRGVIAWARRQHAPGFPQSYGVSFSPDDSGARDRLLAFAEGAVPPEGLRSFIRLATALPVTLQHEGHERTEALGDISMGGVFIRTRLLVPAGTRVTLSVRVPGTLFRSSFEGVVTWVRSRGVDSGYGVCFTGTDERHTERIRQLVEKVRARS